MEYIKRKGWFELVNLNGNIVCDKCLKETDVQDKIILESFDRWFENYKKWING